MSPLFIARFRTDNQPVDDQRTVHIQLNVANYPDAMAMAGRIAETMNKIQEDNYWVFSVHEPIPGALGYGDDIVEAAKRVLAPRHI